MKKDDKQYTMEEIFRKKMEGHEVQADLSDWEVIHRRLPQKTSPIKKWIIIGTGIAASVMAILISFYISDRDEDRKSFTQVSPASLHEESIIEQENNSSVLKQKSQKQNILGDLMVNPHSSGETGSLFVVIPEVKKDCYTQQDEQPEVVEETLVDNHKPMKRVDFYEQKPVYTNAINGRKTLKKNKQGWILSSSLGTNRVLPDRYQYNYSESSNLLSDVWAGWGGGYSMSPKDENLIDNSTDVKHLPPFSFGLTLKKQLNFRFGIESGLIYTYLSSTYKWHEGKNREANQQLHYIGIPVNGIINLFDNSKWGTYASTGFMVEKGIRRKINGDDPSLIFSSTYNPGKTIDGIQWSINGSIGINYHLSGKVSLYFEPRISYYFKNKQPRSIRTDCPVSAGFGMGVKYSL